MSYRSVRFTVLQKEPGIGCRVSVQHPAQTQFSTMFDVGGYYRFKHHAGEQFLFAYGHSVAGQTENYAYVGMYWTWSKGKDDNQDDHTGTLFNPEIWN